MKLHVKWSSFAKFYVTTDAFKGNFCSTFMELSLILSNVLGEGGEGRTCHPARVGPLHPVCLRQLFVLVLAMALKILVSEGC